jgi:hypothetical protein
MNLSIEISMIACLPKQTEHPDLQDPELATLQLGVQTPGIADDLVRSRDRVGGTADRQAKARFW